MDEVKVERRETTLVITLNRPEVKNALVEEMYVGVADALYEASRDLSVRSVVLTGAGDAFCSGVDTRRIAKREGVFEGDSAPLTRFNYTNGVQRMSQAFHACEVPIIAAVNGVALGLGFDLTIQSDIRIAAETAVFSEAFVTFGLIPGDGGFWYLPRIVGYSRAVEMTVTGRRIDAATALDWGLVSKVTPAGGALNAALDLADEIAQRPPHTVRLSKRLIRNAAETSLQAALDMGAMAQAVLTGSVDQKEAAAALFARRPGDFQLR
jgi:enoyl-CoA hydratase/carnithine racemase